MRISIESPLFAEARVVDLPSDNPVTVFFNAMGPGVNAISIHYDAGPDGQDESGTVIYTNTDARAQY